jgi:hypothetical protein
LHFFCGTLFFHEFEVYSKQKYDFFFVYTTFRVDRLVFFGAIGLTHVQTSRHSNTGSLPPFLNFWLSGCTVPIFDVLCKYLRSRVFFGWHRKIQMQASSIYLSDIDVLRIWLQDRLLESAQKKKIMFGLAGYKNLSYLPCRKVVMLFQFL